MKKSALVPLVIFALALVCLTPLVSAGFALLLGVTVALTLGNPLIEHTRRSAPRLLTLAIVGMGAGMNLKVVAEVGLRGVASTFMGILAALGLGWALARAFKIEARIAALISVGTAICGGSAIAAVGPAIKARSHEMSIALGTVFMLNAAALWIFPALGHVFGLTQEQFGLWSALGIHDTSSVVGAALQYGAEAVQVGTTVKLTRALWIVPVTLLMSFVFQRLEGSQSDGGAEPAKKPWFILGFVLAAALVTWVPSLQPAGQLVSLAAKQVLVLTLFLVGLGLTRENIKLVGVRPFLFGLVLWICMASGALIAIMV
ncbi:MAG: putative sulfate exporter family transporter [Bdellovibrionaceae bacterium]|nr:putative sulfate exporter family transporter [Pseudobdellovibrionaceae bacterium]